MATGSFSGEFSGSSTLQSNCIFCKKTELSGTNIVVTTYFSGGNILFYIGVSENPSIIPSSWEQITLNSGEKTTYTIINSGKALYYKIIKDDSTIISTQVNSYGRRTAPAVQIEGLV